MADLKRLILDRGHVKAALTRLKTFVDTSAKTVPVEHIQEKLDRESDLLSRFDAIQKTIEELIEGTDAADSHAAEREDFDSTFYTTIVKAKQIIKARQPRTLNLSQSQSVETPSPTIPETHVKLPTITLPQFEGEYSQWVKFRDTFESLIHTNDSIPEIQKFHYLNSALKGKAARLTEALGISNANYQLAWHKIKRRYEDDKALISHHMRAILNLSPITRESADLLQELMDTLDNHLLALQALGEPIEHWDTPIINIVEPKLDSRTLQEWQKFTPVNSAKSTVKQLRSFLEEHCKHLLLRAGRAQPPNPKTQSGNQQHAGSRGRLQGNSSLVTQTVPSCPLCKGTHSLFQCKDFRTMEPQSRYTKVAELHVCFNCLQPGHRNTDCTRSLCQKCGKKHNTLLHVDNLSSVPSAKRTETVNSKPTNRETTQHAHVASNHTERDHVLLSTAIVSVADKTGKQQNCRVLLDQGSQVNLITRSFCEKIGLHIEQVESCISGVGLAKHGICGKSKITIASHHNNYKVTLPCSVINQITTNIPSFPISKSAIPIPTNYRLADPDFGKPRQIDLLIGNGYIWDLMCVGQHTIGKGFPILLKTRLGWTLAGRLSPGIRNDQPISHVVTTAEVDNQLRRFWEVEEIIRDGNDQVARGTDTCEDHFKKTTTRAPDGRFIVRIPIQGNVNELGDSRKLTEKRLTLLERKLDRDRTLKLEYTKFMREYEALGHMREVKPENSSTAITYYFPHHAVLKDSTTTKVRVVFDGSAKTDTGVSLNDLQPVGPTVQSELFDILLRFRTHKYVLSADIAKMYRQILITPEQWPLQRILWREEKTQPIRTYELLTVTYGTTAAPYLATRALRELGEQSIHDCPKASSVIINDFYVDDLLTGADTIDEAKKLKRDVTNILKQAGFELRKWGSNEPKILQGNNSISQEVDFNTDKEPKTLGLLWAAESDQLRYQVKLNPLPNRVTKRIILSEVSKIFDPLGLLAPIIVCAKLLLQDLWQQKLSWDESLPRNLHERWTNFRTTLEDINEFKIRRSTLAGRPTTISLHGFCDASQKAYGACIYLHSIDNSGQRSVKLLCSKSRVAPLKTISLPRLELCGAVLLAQLMAKTKAALRRQITDEHYWCDSTITLAWIKASPNKWKTFVANRTSEIQRLTNENWRHVASEQNPADLISRGTDASKLRDNQLWWTGPSWLSESSDHWSIKRQPESSTEMATEMKTCNIAIATTEEIVLFDKFSSLSKLLRVIAYCNRFVQRTRKLSVIATTTELHRDELAAAEILVIKLAQRQPFSAEIQQLRNSKEVDKNSKLISLNPFLDTSGCLRVGGRLEHSLLPYNQKHPLILPANHRLTKLIIKAEHERLMHAGTQATLASIRTKYWPISAKNTIKHVIRHCIPCFRAKPKVSNSMMGNLPANRVTPQRPFYTCGVDYAGPFLVKDRTRTRTLSKAYICIFVCFATKATHIELAVDLTTQAFIKCLRRFIARRGRMHTIYSDNGTNFVGAKNELADLGALLQSEPHQHEINDVATREGIRWRFITPNAPHFGGLWEGAVKTAKYHLKRVIGETQLTYEELYTILTQVEACMNSRPLSPISEDPNDLTPLTPGHFLIGEPLLALPDPNLLDVKENRLARSQLLQQLLQHFWKRWQQEYLHQLQQRNKWRTQPPHNLTTGTMVIVKNDNLPQLRWQLGRITEVHPGADGIIRVASIRVTNGIIKRPITKLCILPLEQATPPQ